MDFTQLEKLWEVMQVFHRYHWLNRVFLIVASLVLIYFIYLVTLGRPPLVVHELRFTLLTDPQVRTLREGVEAFEIEFRLLNRTSPHRELHNVFGNLWISGAHFITSTIPPARGQSGGQARVEWDIRESVIPKQGIFIPAKLRVKMPQPGEEVMVGAQFSSTETDPQEYLWKFINDNGSPKRVTIKDPHANLH